jgi:hypothetical protein
VLSCLPPLPGDLASQDPNPEDLIRFWLGHADETVTDGYSKLGEDVQYRKEVAEQVGLGFEFSVGRSDVVPNVPNSQPTKATANAM